MFQIKIKCRHLAIPILILTVSLYLVAVRGHPPVAATTLAATVVPGSADSLVRRPLFIWTAVPKFHAGSSARHGWTEGEPTGRPKFLWTWVHMEQPPHTGTSAPTSTGVEPPTRTDMEPPTSADVEPPTSTDVGQPTSTDVGQPTSTDVGQPTSTDVGQPTSTDVGQPTSTNADQPTNTGVSPQDPDASGTCSNSKRSIGLRDTPWNAMGVLPGFDLAVALQCETSGRTKRHTGSYVESSS